MAVDFSPAVDAHFGAFGTAATFTPAGGSGESVTVILRSPETGATLGAMEFRLEASSQAAALEADLRRSEVAAPARLDQLTVEGETYLVVEEPRLVGSSRLVWRLPLRKTS